MRLAVLCLLGVVQMYATSDILQRNRRYLVYTPPSSKTQLITGFGMPISTVDFSLTMGTKLKYNYRLPVNASVFTEQYVVLQKRDLRIPTRWDVYGVIEFLLDRFGFDGRACMLRAICEGARQPMDKQNGLLEEIVHLIVTPSATGEQHPFSFSGREYVSAEKIGSRGEENCSDMYPECSLNLLDLITDFDWIG